MLLRRTKSGDFGKGSKKAQALREAELERQRQAASRVPPKLPEFANNSEQLSKAIPRDLQPAEYTYSLATSGPGGYYGRASNESRHYIPSAAPPVPPIPSSAFDPYARTESMTHRGRYSYASSAISSINSPRRVRRRKDPTPFNILVIGTAGAGKTSFLEFLKTALALPPRKRPRKVDDDDFKIPAPASGNFIPHFMETEIDNERIGLTLWDSEGIEKNLVDLQLRELSAFLESKFEETFAEEMKVVRSPGVQDTHIHAVFLVLDPSRLDRNIAASRNMATRYQGNDPRTRASGALDDDLDLQILRSLHRKTTVIPVIAKADTITTKHMNVLKKSVWDSIRKADLDPLEALGLDEDSDNNSDKIDEEEEEAAVVDDGEAISSLASSPNSKRLSTQSIRRHKAQEETKEDEIPFLPLSIISPDLYEPAVIGRQFPWGFADPYNEQHCDFTRLKETVFSEWRGELREASREQWYEGWRTNRLKLRDLPYRHR
ncbi:septin [Metarhizium album ARSEF 1941]|uniref:Septin n=1 Tax=Metarhizium album (strain ARSEF 1941) TaxID=1081103 RepID=A0A0B2WZ12_METAS|nr:septin [Metarhizium album ARSEF 1941]KHN98794.1 septin [Metarhizium album ARSEF 1941]